MTLGDVVKKTLIVTTGASLIAYSAVACVFDEWRLSELLNTIITDVRQGHENFPRYLDSLRRDSETPDTLYETPDTFDQRNPEPSPVRDTLYENLI